MIQKFVVLTVLVEIVDCIDLYDYDYETTTQLSVPRELTQMPTTNSSTTVEYQNINCDNFSVYALNCSKNAAKMYNSSQTAPPTPSTVQDWCSALEYLSDCGTQWNKECLDVTDTHFEQDSIDGHRFVVDQVCRNDEFLDKYMKAFDCIDKIAESWQQCYTSFKEFIRTNANTSLEATHYESHFHLCCARAMFRRCTFDALMRMCSFQEALSLQKFSVIVSEGEISHNCTFNMNYSLCPGGDPTPKTEVIMRLTYPEKKDIGAKASTIINISFFTIFILLYHFVESNTVCR